MKYKLSYVVIPLMLVVLLLAGCNSSNNSSPASTVRTQVTTGVITGFGSVFVNGVEFTKKASIPDAQVATFKFDDTAHAQADLKVGMIVTVKGAVDTATKKGEFESIEFAPELRGPADSMVVTGTTGTLTVMGHDVVTSATTSIDDKGTATTLTALQSKLSGTTHPEIEVSGRMDSAGVFHATRISVKADDFGTGGKGKCEIHGKITSAPTTTGGSFTIGNIEVVTTATTSMPNTTAADLVTGASVEVKGTLDANTNTLTADRIEGNKGNHGLGEGVEVEDNVSIQGIAAGGISGGSFTLNGPNGAVTVTVNAATDMGGAAQSSITANAMLEVEGTVQADGSVLATKVKSETEIESESHGGTDSGGGGGGETGGSGGGGGGA